MADTLGFSNWFTPTGASASTSSNGLVMDGMGRWVTPEELAYSYWQAKDQATRRVQMESDREYELRAKGVKQQAEQMAISKGQAAATKWYNEQMVQLAKDKLQEESRQFDLTFGENQRQFNTTASGYLDNGSPTMAREQFYDSSLQGWTDKAIQLGSTPRDWVKLLRYNSGVQGNIAQIPGLNWTQGGQRGNQTFSGQPESNSLSNVMTGMGIGSGNWAAQAAGQASTAAMTPDQQQLYDTAREFGMNSHQSAPGWWESQDPATQEAIRGAAEAQGLDWSSTMARYNRSRWGSSGNSQAA